MRLMVMDSGSVRGIDPSDALRIDIGPALEIKDRFRYSFCYVVDRDTMVPVAPILEYLTDRAIAKGNGYKTIKNKADGCYELFLYLEELGLDYRDVCLENLIEYKERLCAFVSGKTGRPLESGTIKVRLQVAREFFLFHKILTRSTTDELESAVSRGPRGHRTHGQSDPLTVEVKTKVVEYIGDRDLVRLLNSLGDAPGSANGRPSRDWLIATVCVTTGVRLSEALALTVNQILAAASDFPSRQMAQIRLTETKFSKARDILIPVDLVRLLIVYIDGEREQALKVGRVERPRTRDTPKVFVNGSECAPRYSGLPYQPKRADETFALRQIVIGMTRTVPVYDLETRDPVGEREVAKHTIHHLRHTYAIHAWQYLRNLPETDRWMRIQAQLGHQSHEITADIYLRAVKHSESIARGILGDFLKSLVQQS